MSDGTVVHGHGGPGDERAGVADAVGGERWFRSVLESLLEVSAVVREDGGIELLNDPASRIPGLPLDELCALDDRVPPGRLRDEGGGVLTVADRPPYRALRRGEERTGDVVAFDDAAGRRWIEVSTRLLTADRGRAVSVSVVEVTQRHRSEQALTYRLAFEDLVTSISTRFVLLPPDDVRTGIDATLREIGRFLDAGRAYVFELDPLSRTFDETHEWCAAGVPSFREIRRGVSTDVMPWWVERLSAGEDLLIADIRELPEQAWRERRIFGSQSIAALACVPLLSAGELSGFIGLDVLDGPRAWTPDAVRLLRVVGEIVAGAIDRSRAARRLSRAAEEVLRNNAELERANEELRLANRAKDEFLSVASHELRTPLTTILGFVETLRDRGDQLGAERQQEFLEVLHRQSARLYRLVDDLLEMSRITAGRAGGHPEAVALGPVVAELLGDLALHGPDVVVTGVRDAVAFAEPDHIRRMLTNLLENAAKYGRPPIVIDVAATATEVVVSVRDHGPGVPADFVPRLFERFSQASTGTTRSATGTGLGLSIVKDLARLNGGRVGYQPADPGARFTVWMPRAVSPRGVR